MSVKSTNEVGLTNSVLELIIKDIHMKLPHEAMIGRFYAQFNVAKRANSKMVFTNLGTYLLFPYASIIEACNFDELYRAISESTVYKSNSEFVDGG